MKKIQILILACSIGFTSYSQVTTQNKPGTTILNSNSNNSMSGVNPNGNPGTIINNSSNSNAVNNTLITPNRSVTTTIVTTPNNSPVISRKPHPAPVANPNNTIVTTTAVDPNKTSNTSVETRIDVPAYPSPVEPTPTVPNTTTNNTVVNVSGSTLTGLKPMSSSPVLVNYIPEEIVTRLKSIYGNKLYDITMLKKSNNKLLYIVRVHENGAYITHYLDEEGKVVIR